MSLNEFELCWAAVWKFVNMLTYLASLNDLEYWKGVFWEMLRHIEVHIHKCLGVHSHVPFQEKKSFR